MIILPSKEKFIKQYFIEFSLGKENDDYLPDFKYFQRLNSADQYYLAQKFNCDDGVEVLEWIIDSPKCDKGTAALIFWNLEPDFYFEKLEKQFPESEKKTYYLLKKIVEKFRNHQFKKSFFKYDPSDRVKTINWSKTEWNIPLELRQPIKGITPISLGGITHQIWKWQRRRKEAKRLARRMKAKK